MKRVSKPLRAQADEPGTVERLEQEIAALRAGLEHLRRIHHGTRVGSRLHELVSVDQCRAKSCVLARALLGVYR